MHHHTQRYAVAAALALGIWYSLKTALLYFAQDFALRMHFHMKYMEVDPTVASKVHITLTNYLSGVAQVMLYTYIIIMIFGCIACFLKPYFGDSGCCPSNQSGTGMYR